MEWVAGEGHLSGTYDTKPNSKSKKALRYIFEEDFNPAEDMNDALMVLKKLEESVTIECDSNYSYRAYFRVPVDSWREVITYGAEEETLPLAICMMALNFIDDIEEE